MINADDWQKIQRDNKQIWAHKCVSDLVSVDWFLPEYWQRKNAVIGESKGRYTTYFINQSDSNGNELEMVLRHYYRGGLVSRISKDRFIFSSYVSTRAYAELNMLSQMCELNLPVPKPIAAMVTKVGLFKCTNDILIELIPNAKDGYQLLSQQVFSELQWQEIGKTVKRFHQEGVFHSDLNIHNIMFQSLVNDSDESVVETKDNGSDHDSKETHKVWLIDFDRCSFKTPARDWQQANLDRLKRSLEKEKGLNPNFSFTESDWQQLMIGYQQ